jgi:predicted DNA-binding protein
MNEPTRYTEKIGVLLSPATADHLRALAADEERTLSTYVRRLLEAHVRVKEGRRRTAERIEKGENRS